MSLEQCTDKIRQKIAKVSDLNATLKFNLETSVDRLISSWKPHEH